MSRPPSNARASHASMLAPYAQPMNASGTFGGPPAPAYSSTALSRPPSRFEPPPLSMTNGPMPGTRDRPLDGPKKRLIMTCDGTWLNSDNTPKGQKQPPSNVTRLGWAIKETSRDGIPQVVNYQAGVGTSPGQLSKIIGGATGQGLKAHVREAYTYMATNWREGDEIFLIGFSRGAFTARSVGGLIGELGLLTRKGLPFFNQIFEDLEHKNEPNYVSPFPDIPFRNKGPFDRRYVAELVRLGMTRTPIDIKAIAVFDTVGSLGIPTTPVTSIFARGRQLTQYQFYDTSLNPCVENAFQALGLDEHRAAFSPALWEKRSDNKRTNLKQVWFPGVHSNVGGGYDDQEIADITLAWMMSRLEPFLDFRPDFLITQHRENIEYYHDRGDRPRPWSFGELYKSNTGIYALGGSKVRTPGNYYRVDPFNGRPTSSKLKNTNEYIHASVRTRVGLRGPGTEDRGTYEPRALKDWSFEIDTNAGAGAGGNIEDGSIVVWTNRGPDTGGQPTIPEAVLMATELALLRESDRVAAFVKTGVKSRSSRRRRGDDRNGGLNGAAAAGAGAGAGGGRDRRRAESMQRPPRGSTNRDRDMFGSPAPDDDRDRRRRRRRMTDDPRSSGRDRDRGMGRDLGRDQPPGSRRESRRERSLPPISSGPGPGARSGSRRRRLESDESSELSDER